MNAILRKMAISVLGDDTAPEAVERDAQGLPVAFRIWRAGTNVFDGGELQFTAASAEALLAEQTSRARPYAIDFDHLSLETNRPADAGRAAGWHRLAVRDGELWAVDVEWSPDVREGLAEKPPRWRFFSPAFFAKDGEVTSYTNLALCINPMTHGIPLLASQKATTNASRKTAEAPMATEEQLAALDKMIEAEEDADNKAALVAAREALASKKADEEPVETAEKKDDEKKDDEDDDAKKTAAVAHAASLDAVTLLTAKVVELERKAELAAIDALLEKNSTLPEEFKKHCRGKSLDDAKAMLDAVAKTKPVRHAAPARGDTAGDGTPPIDPALGDFLDRAMGVKSTTATLPKRLPDGRFVMHNIRPSDLARLNAQKAKA